MRPLKIAFLATCRALGVFRVARWLTKDRLRILCYHGFAVADEASFRPTLFISAARFERRLEILQALGMRVLPLDEAVQRLYDGTLPPDAVALTIDDGFHSVASIAKPRLAGRGFPATVYQTTYYTDNAAPIFRLVVQYMFWKTRAHSIPAGEVPELGPQALDLVDAERTRRAMWTCIERAERECDEAGRIELCRRLGRSLGVSYDEIARLKMMHLMSGDELASLGEAGLDVQLHTHRHRFPADDRPAAEREIEDNRVALRRWVPGDRHHFCYPSGEYHPRQFEWLDAMDIRSSTTCLPGLNSKSTPRQELRRFLDSEDIRDVEFEAAVCGLLDLLRGRT